MRRFGVAAACGLVVATNVFMLAGIARNRAGAPESRVEMTERELPLVRLGDKDTGVALRIDAHFPPQFDSARLAELGLGADDRVIEAFVALEYRAPGLIAVDVARDAETLRRRHPDRAKFVIARGLVRPGAHVGFRPQLVIPLVYVPAPYNRMLRDLGPAPHYRATLCYGANAEPWVCDCRPGD